MKNLHLWGIVVVFLALCAQPGFAGNKAFVTVTITNGIKSSIDTLGVAVSATDCLDQSLGEVELPPPPPEGPLDTRFLEPACSPVLQGLSLDYHAGSTSSSTSGTPFEMMIQKYTYKAYIGGPYVSSPIFLQFSLGWDQVFDSLELIDAATGGTLMDVKMAHGRDTVTLPYYITSRNDTIEVTDIYLHYRAKPLVVTGVKEGAPKLPAHFALLNNYPNPFNPSTQIYYALPERAFVSLKVYDALGKEVATLVNGFEDAGTRSAVFNAGNYSSGLYFYRLQAGNFSAFGKMMLVK